MISYLRRFYKTVSNKFPANVIECEIDSTVTFASPDNLSLGKWIFIGPESFIDCKGGVQIGDGTIISSSVVVLSSLHDYRSEESVPYGGEDLHRKVEIGRAVWIGYGAMILPGVRIGDGAVVGAGSVVSREVGPGEVVVGNPASRVKLRDGDEWRHLIEAERYRMLIKKQKS